MHGIASQPVEQYILPVAITETVISTNQIPPAYPRTNPIIDMTARVREYDIRLANHADGSGHVCRNHS